MGPVSAAAPDTTRVLDFVTTAEVNRDDLRFKIDIADIADKFCHETLYNSDAKNKLVALQRKVNSVVKTLQESEVKTLQENETAVPLTEMPLKILDDHTIKVNLGDLVDWLGHGALYNSDIKNRLLAVQRKVHSAVKTLINTLIERKKVLESFEKLLFENIPTYEALVDGQGSESPDSLPKWFIEQQGAQYVSAKNVPSSVAKIIVKKSSDMKVLSSFITIKIELLDPQTGQVKNADSRWIFDVDAHKNLVCKKFTPRSTAPNEFSVAVDVVTLEHLEVVKNLLQGKTVPYPFDGHPNSKYHVKVIK